MPARQAYERVGFGFVHVLGVTRLVLLFLSLFASACDSDDPTPKGKLVVLVDSDLAIPKDVDQLVFEASSNDRALVRQSTSFVGQGDPALPMRYEVPFPGSSRPVTLRAVGSQKGVARVQREAVAPIPRSYTGFLRLSLSYLCDGSANEDGTSTCPEGETCILGSCTSSALPESVLSSDPWATGDGTSSLACLDVQSCFDTASTFDVNADICSLEVPEDADTDSLNVAVVLPEGSPGVCSFDRCWVVLDAGSGWVLEGGRVLLPQALCAHGDLRVALSTRCAQKVAARSLCPSSEVGGSGELGGSGSRPGDLPVEGMVTSCPGASLRACGNCGSQGRTCKNGRWSDWSECSDEGACLPNTTESCGEGGNRTCEGNCQWGLCISPPCEGPRARACGNCGTQTRVCNDGAWLGWSECSDEGECAPDSSESCDDGGTRTCAGNCSFSQCVVSDCEGPASRSCGNCGTQTRSCAEGAWSDWSECTEEGACAPDTTEACGSQGSRTCGGSCQWGECLGQQCSGPNTESCGNCGTRRRFCDNGEWSAWSACSDQGECAPNSSEACGNGNTGRRECGGDCQYRECTGQQCSGSATEVCGNCGTRTRTCNNGVWSSFGPCAGEGVCARNATQSCGSGGTQTCTNSCTWGTCGDQQCSGASSRSCGNCGTETRTCNNSTGEWSAWSGCQQQGVCQPDTNQACGTGGTQRCTSSCEWGDCTCTASQESQSCGNCGTQTRTCSGGVWSGWSACDERDCRPGSTEACESTGIRTCNTSCNWGSCQNCEGPSSRSCGNCGTQSRTCSGGVWSNYGPCSNEGVCTPGFETECQNQGEQTCTAACTWGACVGQQCPAPAPTRACARCGTQPALCNSNTGQWGDWSTACNDQGACERGEERSCGAGGKQTCTETCQWGACQGQSCPGAPPTRSCGNCGTQTAVCDPNTGQWGAFGPCEAQGECAPGATGTCGQGGSRSCTRECKWGPCECVGASTQPCYEVDCGIQERKCDGGTWSPWGTCVSQGECKPGQVQACRDTVEARQQCGAECKWSECARPNVEQIQSGLKIIGPLAVDAKNLYAAYNDGVSKIPVDTLKPESVATAQNAVTSLAYDSTYLYWTLNAGPVLRVRIDGGEPERIVREGRGVSSGGLVVDATNVYLYSGTSSVLGAPLNGKEPPPWEVPLKGAALNDLVSNGQHLFYTDSGSAQSSTGSLGVLTIKGTEPATLLSGLAQPRAIAIDNSHKLLVFAAGGAIYSIPATPTKPDLAGPLVHRAGVIELAADNEFMYWTAGTAAEANGRVMRATLKGTEPTVLVGLGASLPKAIAVDAKHVYFALENVILRTPK